MDLTGFGYRYDDSPEKRDPAIERIRQDWKISKVVNGRETIPSKYNTDTELGHEETEYVEGVGSLQFSLLGR